MCTVTAIGLTGAIISGAGRLFSGIQSSEAAEFNAQVAERAAANEAARVRFQNERARERGARLRGTQRARIAAAGVQVQGTPLEVLADTAAEEELEVQSNLFGSRITQQNLRDRARLSRQQGRGALFGGALAGLGTVISGGATAQRLGFGNTGDTARIPAPGIPDPFAIGAT